MRKYAVLILFLLAMFVSGGVLMAQNTPAAFCGTLSQADCDLLTQSNTAMQTVKSAGFGFQLDVTLSGLPDATPDHLNFRMTGHGAYALDSEGLSGLLLSPNELAQQMDKLPQLMEDAVRAISADSNILMFFSDDFAAAMGQSGTTKWPGKAGFSARLVNGMAYFNLGKLTELDPKNDLPPGWFGFDLATYLRQQLEQQSGGSTGITSTLGTNFGDAATMQKYISIERIEDATLDGQSAAVFKTTLDLAGYYGSTDFQTLLQQQLEQSGSASGISQADIDQAIKGIQALVDGLNFEVTQSIGLDDHYTHQATLSLNWLLDMNALAGTSGTGASGKQRPINIQLNFQGNLNQFNNAPAITAPEDATIIPLDQINNMGQSFTLPQ